MNNLAGESGRSLNSCSETGPLLSSEQANKQSARKRNGVINLVKINDLGVRSFSGSLLLLHSKSTFEIQSWSPTFL